MPFSLAGTIGKEKQYIILAGDSGRIVIFEYNKDRNLFMKIHQETFGKSGCRRIVPGQHLATDPRGRACMISATEKQKLVYVLNRDAAAKLTISSPLEAHKSHNIVFSTCGLDNGFENPIFATIELDYADTDQVNAHTCNLTVKMGSRSPALHCICREGPRCCCAIYVSCACDKLKLLKLAIITNTARPTMHWVLFQLSSSRTMNQKLIRKFTAAA